jgi:hypothetical protein
METDYTSMAANIRRVFPASDFTPVPGPELASIREQYPGVPEHYLAFLRHVGYGSLGDNFMVYSGPVEPDEIFDASTVAELTGIVLIGDNFAGDVIGFDTRDGWRLVRSDIAYSPEPMPEAARTVGQFLAEWLADRDPD